MSWNLAEHVERLVGFRRARDWEQFHRPKELAAALSIEASELQELFLWRDSEDAAAVRSDSGRMQKIEQEIADVAIFLLLLCNDLEIDLSRAIRSKIADNEKRYDVASHCGRATKADH